ncbi:hypothetical protein [Planctomicrobium sp. SH527]|uniref:hypothetical protein n=1 Tax=Planctomicrobium sp. SH527 TaxID=3448123 RepID=UPI003F5CA773
MDKKPVIRVNVTLIAKREITYSIEAMLIVPADAAEVDLEQLMEAAADELHEEEWIEDDDSGIFYDFGSIDSIEPSCQHDWMVFSTAIEDVCLLLECTKCRSMGTVDDPTEREWGDAFYAPSHPYKWKDNSRVNFREVPVQEESSDVDGEAK